MTNAEFIVKKAGPYITIQDRGKPALARFGVPNSGPMDRASFFAANLSVGNPLNSAVIEVSLGGLELQCGSGSATFTVAGGAFLIELDGAAVPRRKPNRITSGQCLSIMPGAAGCWCYLAFAGDLVAPSWLGSQATHSQSGLGGGLLRPGTVLKMSNPRVEQKSEASPGDFEFDRFNGFVRVVPGPQEHRFVPGALDTLLKSEFVVSQLFDRMGTQLVGPRLEIGEALSIPSEPVMRGAIQVSGSGTPTVLMADHQTTGGYPKIATVIDADLDRFAQCRPGEKIRFRSVTPLDAAKLAKVRNIELKYHLNSKEWPEHGNSAGFGIR